MSFGFSTITAAVCYKNRQDRLRAQQDVEGGNDENNRLDQEDERVPTPPPQAEQVEPQGPLRGTPETRGVPVGPPCGAESRTQRVKSRFWRLFAKKQAADAERARVEVDTDILRQARY
jgi:hypothetical protein